MPVVILDRDGVINEDSDAYIKSPAEWVPIPGSLEAIARLNHAGYRTRIPRIHQRLCMKGFSQFRTAVSAKGHSFGEVVFAHGGLEVG